MQFLHAAAGSPITSTWIDAISKGYYIMWPGLTADNVRKHLPKSIATSQGHLEQKRKNIASTKRNTAMSRPHRPAFTSRPHLLTYT
eukprot:3777019-Ditylum_brightwellii.AAC.1